MKLNLKSLLYRFFNEDCSPDSIIIFLTYANQNKIESNDIKKFYSLLSRYISKIDLKATKFISLMNSIFDFDWFHHDEKTIKSHVKFLIKFSCYHDNIIPQLYKNLLKLFGNGINQKNKISKKINKHVHKLIKKLIFKIPSSKQWLFINIARNFPYRLRTLETHENYINNILKMLKYNPSYEDDVLRLILVKANLIEIEMNKISRGLFQLIENKIAELKEEPGTDNVRYEILIKSDVNKVIEGVKEDIVNENMSNKLDSIMDIMFRYVRKVYKRDGGLCKIRQLINITNTNSSFTNTCSMQLLFYMTSLSDSYAVEYLSSLLTSINDNSKHDSIKIPKALLIGGFVAHSRLIRQVEVLKAFDGLYKQAEFLLEYFVSNKINIITLTSPHSSSIKLFFTLCQSIFYIFIFRNTDLYSRLLPSQISHKIKFKKNQTRNKFNDPLKLSKLIFSKLNPLLYCNSDIAINFAIIAYELKLINCFHILKDIDTNMSNYKNNLEIHIPFSNYNTNNQYFNDIYYSSEECEMNLIKRFCKKKFDKKKMKENGKELINGEEVKNLKLEKFHKSSEDDKMMDVEV